MDRITQRLISTISDEKSILKELSMYINNIAAFSRRAGTAGMCHNTPDNRPHTGNYTDYADFIGKPVQYIIDSLAASENLFHRSLLYAVMNSALSIPENTVSSNAFDLISEHEMKTLPSVLIGHFPKGDRFRERGYRVSIVELDPKPGDIHWDDSEKVLNEARIVFMTGITLLNGTFEEIVDKTPNAEKRILLGPTVPMSQVFFEEGITIIGGSEILDYKKMSDYWRLGGSGMKYAPKDAVRSLCMVKDTGK